jgi:predicted Ser/Thr protein kinase
MPYNLETYKTDTLLLIAKDMQLHLPNKKKSSIIEAIAKAFDVCKTKNSSRDENSPRDKPEDKYDKYTRYEQLGNKGKEGTTYLVKNKRGQELAMKTFRKTKSSNTLKKEYKLLRLAGKAGVAPRALDYNTKEKYIVMEKMSHHLYDMKKSKTFSLSKKQQERILHIFKTLDEIKVFHNDANILNYMVKNGEVYMIDFGFSKEIDDKLCAKLKTDKPNLYLMTIGLILKLKELSLPSSSWNVLEKVLPPEYKKKYKI